jgi:hypothetical protein
MALRRTSAVTAARSAAASAAAAEEEEEEEEEESGAPSPAASAASSNRRWCRVERAPAKASLASASSPMPPSISKSFSRPAMEGAKKAESRRGGAGEITEWLSATPSKERGGV